MAVHKDHQLLSTLLGHPVFIKAVVSRLPVFFQYLRCILLGLRGGNRRNMSGIYPNNRFGLVKTNSEIAGFKPRLRRQLQPEPRRRHGRPFPVSVSVLVFILFHLGKFPIVLGEDLQQPIRPLVELHHIHSIHYADDHHHHQCKRTHTDHHKLPPQLFNHRASSNV